MELVATIFSMFLVSLGVFVVLFIPAICFGGFVIIVGGEDLDGKYWEVVGGWAGMVLLGFICASGLVIYRYFFGDAPFEPFILWAGGS